MKLRSFVVAFVVLQVVVVLPKMVSAQGVIVPIPCDMRPCRPIPRPMPQPVPLALPVKSINIDTKIDGQVATTHLEQVFRNDTPYTLEGTYFFPIPETASIVEFAIWENGKRLVGEVRSREEARRIYDEIVRRQRDPGLLEYAGKDLFQASIFPIPPHSDKKLELKYTEVLKAESGTVAYRYPLGTGHNVWRRPTPIPDRPHATTNVAQQFGTISGSIRIAGRESIRNIYSPTHQIDVKRPTDSSANISFETKGGDSDFQLYFGYSNADVGVSVATYREPGKDGYFLMMLSPKDSTSDRDLVDKDVVFVLDTSGSMADEGKMEKARKALLFGVRTLREGDRFNVIGFAGEERLMEAGLISADAAGKSRGEAFVGRLQPTGGTNINDALIAGMKQFDKSARPKMLVFMTDGLPTVGETNIDKIIANSRTHKVEGLRLFTFGVGYDVNTRLLDKLAAENSGDADYIEPKEDLEIRVSNFFAKVNSPVLTDVEFDFAGLKTDLMYPRLIKDVFKGTQIAIIGRYSNSSDLRDIAIKLRGRTGRDSRVFNYPGLDFPLRNDENEFLPRLWATRRVGWLIEQIRTNGDNKELRDEIVDLGTRYGIVTPYTSYLATDGSERGMNIVSRRADMSPRSAAANVDITGSGAVAASKMAREQKDKQTISDSDDPRQRSANLRKVGLKTFYFENGSWVDSEYREESKLAEIRIAFGSDAYFDLALNESELGRYLSVGESVVIVWKGKVYRVSR